MSPPKRPPLRLPFDDAAVAAIAAELGVPARTAAYRVAGEAVYELRLHLATLPGAEMLVVLWPSLRRVDVRLLAAPGGAPVFSITGKDVAQVEIYAGVEVMFRRRAGGVLFVTRTGVAAMSD
jgi:hypothetical protein